MLIVHYPESLMMSEGIIEEHSAAAHQGKNVCNTMLYQNIRDNVCYTLLHRNHPFFSYRHPSLTNNAEYFVFLRIFPNFLKIVLRKLAALTVVTKTVSSGYFAIFSGDMAANPCKVNPGRLSYTCVSFALG